MFARVARSIATRRISSSLLANNVRTFSVASIRLSHGKVDKDLASKLRAELTFEKESVESEKPSFISDFKSFSVEDKAGEKEVTLKKTFGNEKISVIFSTDALNESENEFEGEEEEESFPVNMTVLIEKPEAGCMEVSVTLEGESFFIENVSYGKDASLMLGTTAEADWARRGTYGGPVFQDLDEELQNQFHDFLAERGINSDLAGFIRPYIEFKEQKEYMGWLDSAASFISK